METGKKVVTLSFEDVYHLYNVLFNYRTITASEDIELLFRKISKVYAACLDDIPVSLLYPGAMAAILDEMLPQDGSGDSSS